MLVGGEKDIRDPNAKELWFRADQGGFVAGGPIHDVRFDNQWLWLDARYSNGEICSQPFGLKTDQISVGATPMSEANRVIKLGSGGELIVARQGYVERFHNNHTGVEQSWLFESQPTEPGDIIVRVAVSGQDYLGTTPSGLHFAPPGDVGTIYSHGTWIDANGVESYILSEFIDGQIVLRVPAAVVASSAFPAVLDPQVDRVEVAVDSPLTGSPTGAQSTAPAIAFSGAEFLAVWRDNRNGTNSDIFATRLSAQGALLTTTGLAISTSPGVQANPAVAFVNGSYLVVWEDFKLPAGEPDLKAARVTTAGVVTQLGTVATGAGNRRARIAVSNTQALVVFERGAGIAAAHYNGVTFSAAVTVSSAGAEPSVAANPALGSAYLVTYTDRATTDLGGQLVSSAGAPSGSPLVISNGLGSQELSSASFAGGNFIVVWQNVHQGRKFFGTRVSTAGVALDTRVEGLVTVGGVAVGRATAIPTQASEPSLVCAAASCLITWQDRRAFATLAHDVYAQRINPGVGLTNIGTTETAISTVALDQRSPKAIVAGTNYMVVWQDFRDTDPEEIFGARVSVGTGALLDSNGIFIAVGNNQQTSPTVARVPGAITWTAAWTDSRSRGLNIHGTRVQDTLAVTALSNTLSNGVGSQSSPSIAASSTQYLAAWTDLRGADADIFASRIGATGTVLDVAGIPIVRIAGDQTKPSVASNGTSFLVVWQDRHTSFDVVGTIVSSAGVVGTPFTISGAAGDQLVPSATFDSSAGVYVVVWQDARAGGGARDIYAARVTTLGAVLDPNSVLVSAAAGSQLNPVIAFGSNRSFVAWEDRRVGTDIFGTRLRVVNGVLVVEDPAGIAIVTAVGRQQQPTVTFVPASGVNSNVFALAWTDERELATRGSDIFGNLVFQSSGAVGSEYAIAFSSIDERAPALARAGAAQSDGSLRVLVTYHRYSASLSTTRVVMRRITFAATQTTCTGTCNTVCAANTSCDVSCAGATLCKNDCLQTGSSCTINCEDSLACRTDCRAGATCVIDCKGAADCRADCSSTGTPRTRCDVDCNDANMGLCNKPTCEGSAECVLRCFDGDPDCKFATCSGGASQLRDCGIISGAHVFTCHVACPTN